MEHVATWPHKIGIPSFEIPISFSHPKPIPININMFKSLILLGMLATTSLAAAANNGLRNGRDLGSYDDVELTITVRNIAYSQPMSPFFVFVHNGDAPPLFEIGKPATPALGALAEDANTELLKEMFKAGSTEGVASVKVVPNGQGSGDTKGLLEDGEYTQFTVTVSNDYPYVSMASMAVNTNDCFVGINAKKLYRGMELTTPGYDSGTELNNEDCMFIPGPAW